MVIPRWRATVSWESKYICSILDEMGAAMELQLYGNGDACAGF